MISTDVEPSTNAVDDNRPKSMRSTKSSSKTIKSTSSSVPPATISQVFSNAEVYDIVLMTVGTIGALVTGASIPLFNVLFGQILDQLNKNPNSFQEGINRLCIDFVILAAANVVSGFLQVYCWSATGERQTQKFREKYANAILSQEIGWFDTCGANELATKLAELIGKAQDGLGRKVGDLMQYVAQFVAALAVAFYLNWKLTLVLLCALPFIGAAGAFMINAVTSAQNQSFEQYAGAGGVASESINAIRTVTALNIQPSVVTNYRKFLFEAMHIGTIKGLKVGLGNGGLFGACFLTYALGFWYGGNLVADSLESNCTHNCLTGGDVMAVFFSTIMGSLALGQIAPPLTAFFAAKAAIGIIFETLDRKPLIDGLSDEGEKPDVTITGEVRIDAINFAYPSRPNIVVCRDYDLHVKAGETVALVGASGSGKSTIINLLLRFYDPQSGVISLDGYDLKKLNIKWLRSHIGYVGQEPVLFAGTIADNIAYGLNPEISVSATSTKEEMMQKIVAAAKLANAHEFISKFPLGYDTDVGSNGVAMSGGQKQRIAIARALIKKPVVLLLDEATSALDAASERIVQQSIDELAHKQTTILVAHRLSTIRKADKICLIHDGQIAEMGTHDELIALQGKYADLVKLQMTNDDEIENSSGIVSDKTVSVSIESQEAKDVKQEDTKLEDKELKVAGDQLAPEQSKAVARRVWELTRRYPGLLFLGFAGAIVFGAVFPCWGLMLARTQEMFYLPTPADIRAKASLYACYYILLAGSAFLSSTFQFYGILALGERLSSHFRSEMFEAILRREIGFFDMEENSVGTLTTRLADDSRIVNKAFSEGLAKQIQAMFTLAIGLGLSFSASWKISFVVLACFPLSIIASSIQMQAIAGQQYDQDDGGKSQQDATAKSGKDNEGETSPATTMAGGHGSVISTAFTHMRTVSAFSMHHKVSEHYAVLTRAIAARRSSRSLVAGLGFGASNCILFMIYALLFWYGSKLIEKGLSFVDLMTSILTLMLGALGLGQALADLGDQKTAVLAASRIFKNIDDSKASPIDGLSPKGTTPASHAKGKVELRGVNFHYPTRPNVEVAKNYNLVIEPGETIALVGPSGSGKSTIINLLLRFYDPNAGTVLLDDVDVKDLNVRWLRSQIGYVGQEPVLFAGTVEENVAKGRAVNIEQPLLTLHEAMVIAENERKEREASKGCFGIAAPGAYALTQNDENARDEELGNGEGRDIDEDILSACKASNAHDFISAFTDGYDTDIGEGSKMVSGGQKQRIAIARALIKKPAVLLLDEATSALDAASERVVQQSIDTLAQSKAQTTIIIAHRLSTIRNADRIVVVDHGKIVEIGSHEELLNIADGLYKQLWEKQNGGQPISRNTSATVLNS